MVELEKHKRQNRQLNTRSFAVKPFTAAMPNRSVGHAELCFVKQAISGGTGFPSQPVEPDLG